MQITDAYKRAKAFHSALEFKECELIGLRRLLELGKDDPVMRPQLTVRVASAEAEVAALIERRCREVTPPTPQGRRATVSPITGPSPEPWTAWCDYDAEGFIYQAGVDSGPDREAGICEYNVCMTVCENAEPTDKELFNAGIIADTNLIAAAPVMLRALKKCVAEWGKRDVFLLGPEKLALKAANEAIALAEKRTSDGGDVSVG